MKSRVVALGAAVAVIAVVAVLFFAEQREEGSDEFKPFEGGDTVASDRADTVDGAAADVAEGLAVPTSASRRAGVTAADTANDRREPDPRAALRGGDDTLNNPGPTPDEIAKRAGVSGAAEPKGTLTKADVQRGIKAVTPLVKACYEAALVDFPDAAGKVTVGFRIIGEEDEGRVEMSELDQDKTTLFDEKLHDCMLKSIGEATFDAPEGGGTVSVTYPFNFQSADETDE